MDLFARNISIMLIMIAAFLTMCDARAKVDVKITNDMTLPRVGANIFQIHCKSQKDDLGVHGVLYPSSYEFHFWISSEGNPITYVCNVEFYRANHNFIAFIQKPGTATEAIKVEWKLRRNEKCLYNNNQCSKMLRLGPPRVRIGYRL